MAEITAVVNQKGGTGKTTMTMNLGSALASLGKKVMLVDVDSHASLSYSFGITDPDGTMADVFNGSKTLEEIVVEREGMLIAPASTDLADIELFLMDKPGRENYLLRHLAAENELDYIFIDSPPTLSLLTINALKAADQLLVPMQMEVLSLHGLTSLLATVAEFRRVFRKPLPVKGIVPVMYNSRIKLSQEILTYIGKNFDERIFESKIRHNVRIAESPSFAQSVIHYAPKSNGASDFMNLAREFIKR